MTYIFTFGEINSRQVNVGGIQIFFAQFQTLKLRKEMLNVTSIYLFGIKRTKCKYIDTSLQPKKHSFWVGIISFTEKNQEKKIRFFSSILGRIRIHFSRKWIHDPEPHQNEVDPKHWWYIYKRFDINIILPFAFHRHLDLSQQCPSRVAGRGWCNPPSRFGW